MLTRFLRLELIIFAPLGHKQPRERDSFSGFLLLCEVGIRSRFNHHGRLFLLRPSQLLVAVRGASGDAGFSKLLGFRLLPIVGCRSVLARS
jgi:hypothetical protein